MPIPTLRSIGWFAVLALAAGCGGSRFSTDQGDDAATDAPPSDASVAADGPDSDAATPSDSSRGDEATSDAGSPAPEAASDADTGSDAVGPDGATEPDAGADAPEAGEPDSGLDSGAGDGNPDAQDAAAEAEACVPVLFFLDDDGDGYGGTTTSKACVAPSPGSWVTTGGDCDDSNSTVNPGQAAYFDVGYMPTGGTRVSFDYNCDGQEIESGSAAKASCGVVSLTCVGSGYLEATPVRSGAGVDPFCGSAVAVTCVWSNLVCTAGAPYGASPIACH